MPFVPTSSDPLTALMEYGQAFNKTANINAHLEEGATPEEMLEYLQSTGRIATGERAAQLKDTESWGRIIPGAAADLAKTVLNAIPGMQGVAASIPSGETVSNQMSSEAAGRLGSYIKSGLSPFASLLSTGTTGLQYGKEYMRQKGYEIPESIDEGIDTLSRSAEELYKKPFETGDVTLAERGGGDILEGWKNLTPDERARWLASGTGSVVGSAGTMLLGAGKTGKILSAIGNWAPTGKVGKFIKAIAPEGYLLPIGAQEAEEIFSGQLEEKARTNENLDLTRGLIASYAAMVSEKWGGGGRIIGNMLSGAGVKGKSAIGAIVREGLRGGLEESLFQEPLQTIIEEYGKTPKAIEEERFYTQTLPMAMEAGASAFVGTTAMGGAHGAKGRSRAMWEHAQAESENVRDLKAMDQKQRDYFASNIPQITSTLQSQPILNIMALQQSVASDPSAPTGIKEALASLVESKSTEATKAGLALPDEAEISALSTRNKELYTPDSSSPLLGSFKLIVDKGDGNSVIGWHGNEITVPTLATKSPSSMRFDQMSTDEANSTLKFLHDSGFVSTRGYEALSQQLAQSPENLNRIMLDFQTVRDDLSKKAFKATKNFQPAAIPGEYTRAVNDALLRGQINIYSGHATDTIPHEIAHPIWDSMPDSFKQAYTEYAKATHEDFLKTPIGRAYANREDLRNYIANPQERFAIEFAEAYYVPALREHIQRQKYTGSTMGRMVLAVKDFVRKIGSMMGAKPTGIAADVAIKNAKVSPEQLILINKQYKDMAGFGKAPAAKVTRADVAAKKEAEALPAKQAAHEEEVKGERERAAAMGTAETEALGTFGEEIEHPDWTQAAKVEPGAPASDINILEREHAAPSREAQQMADQIEAMGGGSDEAIRIAERVKEMDIDAARTRRESAERTAMAQAEEVRNKEAYAKRVIEKGKQAQERATEESVGELGKRPLVEMKENIEPQKARLSELEARQGVEAEASDIGRALAEQQKHEAQEAAEWASEYLPESRVSELSDADKRFYEAFSGEGVSYSLKPNPSMPYGKPQPARGRFVLDIRGKREHIIVNPNLLDAVSMSKEKYGSLRALYDEQGGNLYIFSPTVLHSWMKDAMGWGQENSKNGIHLMLNDIDIARLRAGKPEFTLNWLDRDKQSHSLFDDPTARMNLKAAYPDTPVKFDRKSTGMWMEYKKGGWEGNEEVNYSYKPTTIAPEATTSRVLKAIYNDTARMYDEFRKRKAAPAEPASADMSDVKNPLEQGFDELQSFEQLGRYNGRIARGLLGTMNRLSKSHFWEKYLGSPEHFKHPVLQKLVHLFTEVRDTDRHKIFYHLDSFSDDMKRDMNITHVKAEKVSDAMADLKYQGATEKQKKFNLNYESKQYGLLRDMVEDGDIHYIRNRGDEETAENTGDIDERTQKLINKWKAKGASEETIEVYRMMRHSYDSALDLQLNKMAALKELLGQQKPTEQTKRMSDALTEAMEHMNSWRGFYAPRIRNRGDWVVRAKRKEADSSGKMKEAYFRDNAQTEAGALFLAEKLRQSGWDVAQPFLSQKPPEDVYNAVKVMDVRQILNAALERMSEEAKSEQDLDKRAQLEEANLAFSEDVIESIANVIRERGYRSTAIRRGEHYVSGYNVDPLGRFIWYLSNTSNGMAKATVAQEAIRLMAGEIKKDEQGNKYRTGGLNAAHDRQEYETARDYISNQLRNATLADNIVGYGKTAAALWFLTSPKSALVNLLALVTNAPPVISHVVTGGKYANYKVAKDISKATGDYYAYWRNKEKARLTEDERAFMKWVKENEYDAPEFTRASLQLAKNPFQTATATLMDKAMMFFANTEKLNRGATLLAAYRIARDQMGMDTINAARRIAVEATWKTHGKYGKGTDIMLAQGTGILPRVAQMAYTFSKFPHNHLQMMKRMATKDSGMTERDWKNFCWMLMMPMLLVGGAGLPFKDQWFKLFGAMARMFGFQGDAQKFFHDQVRANFGSRAEKFARSGLLGQLGMDVTGSIGIGAPNITPWSLGGAAGGVMKNLVDAGHYAKTGQVARAFETAAPTVIGSVLKGVREREGIKTKEGYTLFTPEGKPYVPDSYETLLRVLGFRSSEASMQSSRVWEIRAEKKPYTDMRNDIYEEIRSAITFNDEGKPIINESAIKEVQEKAKEYNKKVDKYNATMGLKGGKSDSMVPYITPTSFKNQLQNAAKPKKQALKELKTLQ